MGLERRVVLANCGLIDPESFEEAVGAGAYAALARVLEEGMSPEGLRELVSRSGLRGRGGAGFPTGRKWSLVAPGPDKYVVCNADEGEPGTFKDRLIMEGDPHRLIEGIALAAYAIGAEKGFMYIRGEYRLAIRRLGLAIQQAREHGLLGERILGTDFSFELEIKVGAGSYVCGEETALLESIEGKRGFPRLKPPYPGERGLWGRPTVVNNVETLANIPPIVLQGPDWFRSLGTPDSPGTKVFTLSGRVARPGAVEAEMGITLRELIYDYGGGPQSAFKAALVGGAAGAFLGPDELDVPLDFDSLREQGAVLGSGAVLVLGEGDPLLPVLQSILHFFRHESCGQCIPCRLGTGRLVEIADRLAAGEGREGDIELMLELADLMRKTSLCPLGQSPYLAIRSAWDRFPDELRAAVGTKG